MFETGLRVGEPCCTGINNNRGPVRFSVWGETCGVVTGIGGAFSIGLLAGTNAFRFFPGRFAVAPEEADLELDVEGNRVRGFLDAATLAFDATLEMTVLRVERSRTEGRNLPVI